MAHRHSNSEEAGGVRMLRQLRLHVVAGGAAAAVTVAATATATAAAAPAAAADDVSVRELYTKTEHMVPMRDGVRLYVAVFAPKPGFDGGRSLAGPMPMLMQRTPYSCAPYGHDLYPPGAGRGDMLNYLREGFIFVRCDVRGRYASEGSFVHMRPHIDDKTSVMDIDESSDTYDTIEWLLTNVPGNNGNVGIMGISYPGFYSAAGMIDSHPALKCASPQAPINDFFIGDVSEESPLHSLHIGLYIASYPPDLFCLRHQDFHHNGCLYLPHAFRFLASFGKEGGDSTRPGRRFGDLDYGTPDGYQLRHITILIGTLD
jgi:predicted acyl esterase